jgi:hypothetical protein
MIEAELLRECKSILPSFKGHDTQDKYVISFDTEQSKFIRKEYNVELLKW